MRAPLLAVLLAILLAACAPPVDVAATRAACDLGPDAVRSSPLPTHSGAPPISAACAAALGDDFGLDWASFGAQPAAVRSADRPIDLLLTGLYVGLAGDFGVVADLTDHPDLHPGLRRDLDRLVRQTGAAPSDPAADLLYQQLADRIDDITEVAWLDHEARYEQGSVLVGAGHLDRLPGIPVWALLAHESMHWHQGGHSPCLDAPGVAACDPGPAGPLGFEATVAELYGAALPPGTPARADHCDAAWRTRRSACGRIVGPDAGPACALPPREACAADYSSSKSG